MNTHSCTVTCTCGSARIASPAYQKRGPLEIQQFVCIVQQSNDAIRTHSKFENKLRNKRFQKLLIICFTSYNLKNFSNPEGNFGGNQLLNGSISLSPLYTVQTNDLHVSIVTSFHQSFPWLLPYHV